MALGVSVCACVCVCVCVCLAFSSFSFSSTSPSPPSRFSTLSLFSRPVLRRLRCFCFVFNGGRTTRDASPVSANGGRGKRTTPTTAWQPAGPDAKTRRRTHTRARPRSAPNAGDALPFSFCCCVGRTKRTKRRRHATCTGPLSRAWPKTRDWLAAPHPPSTQRPQVSIPVYTIDTATFIDTQRPAGEALSIDNVRIRRHPFLSTVIGYFHQMTPFQANGKTLNLSSFFCEIACGNLENSYWISFACPHSTILSFKNLNG